MSGAAGLSVAAKPELFPFPTAERRRADLDGELAAYFTEESSALDGRRYDDWLKFLDDRFVYQVPVPVTREDPRLSRHSDEAFLFEATKHILGMKVGRIDKQHAWSDRPSGVMRHFLSGTRVFETDETDVLRAETNVFATYFRGESEGEFCSASRVDVVLRSGDGLRLLWRRVLLDVTLPSTAQLSIIY